MEKKVAAVSNKKKSRTEASRDRWFRIILQNHDGRTRDESRITRAQQWEVCLRKCRAVRVLAMRTRALVGEALRQMAESSAPEDHEVVRERWLSAQNATRGRSQRKIDSLEVGTMKARKERSRKRSSSPNYNPRPPVSTLRGDSSSEESARGEAARLIGARDTQEMFEVGNASSDSEVDDRDSRKGQSQEIVDLSQDQVVHGEPPPNKIGPLLKQLKVEPSSSKDCATKFMLFEAYATEVEDMRKSLMKFHEESRPMLPQAFAVQMANEIQGIDSREAMSIPTSSQHWFVYEMMHKAEKNNFLMAGKLDTFEKKLKFLAEGDQKECPVCLEAFNEVDHKAKTLACCHKVCTMCWQRWCAFMESSQKPIFCPCCHHVEFLGTVKAELDSPDIGVSLLRSQLVPLVPKLSTARCGLVLHSIRHAHHLLMPGSTDSAYDERRRWYLHKTVSFGLCVVLLVLIASH